MPSQKNLHFAKKSVFRSIHSAPKIYSGAGGSECRAKFEICKSARNCKKENELFDSKHSGEEQALLLQKRTGVNPSLSFRHDSVAEL